MTPRLMIAALRGGSGKTILSAGLLAAWHGQGLSPAPFKKGPDFIDPGWLSFAAGRACYNLDPFLMTEDQMIASVVRHSEGTDISLIEGNRGLFDGLDVEGSSSTAGLARLLKAPVVLIVDVSMATRTIAAIVKGCQVFDPELDIAGVILNRVAGPRQEQLITSAIETYCGLPVLGAVPRLKENPFPERHMGLVPFQERDQADQAVFWAREVAEKYLHSDLIWEIARKAGELAYYGVGEMTADPKVAGQPVRIGFIRDRAFWFYYPENLEALERLGAALVELDALSDSELPDLDALYIGGGFPETQAQALADNKAFRKSLKEAIERGLPVYAECGGLMYLGERLLVDNRSYPMVGALPVEFVVEERPQGHGYTILQVVGANPYYAIGTTVRGHEFHYSRPVLTRHKNVEFDFRVVRGGGIDGGKDGMRMNNVLATYTHVHAVGNPEWAEGLIRAAALQKKRDNIIRGEKSV